MFRKQGGSRDSEPRLPESRQQAPAGADRQTAKAAVASAPSVVSAKMHVTGDVTGEADLQIDGTVSGSVRARAVVVGAEGRIEGDVVAGQISLLGSVTGNLRARVVTLGAGARLEGDIEYETLAIERGAVFAGGCRRIEAAAPVAKPGNEARTAPATGNGTATGDDAGATA